MGLQNPIPITSGLDEMLAALRREARPRPGAGPACENAGFSQGYIRYTVPYPSGRRSTGNGLSPDNPITSRLESLVLPWCAPLELLVPRTAGADTSRAGAAGDSPQPDVRATVLAQSSPTAWLQKGRFDLTPPARCRCAASRRRARPTRSRSPWWVDSVPLRRASRRPQPGRLDGRAAGGGASIGESPETQILVIGNSQFASSQLHLDVPGQPGVRLELDRLDDPRRQADPIRSRGAIDRPLGIAVGGGKPPSSMRTPSAWRSWWRSSGSSASAAPSGPRVAARRRPPQLIGGRGDAGTHDPDPSRRSGGAGGHRHPVRERRNRETRPAGAQLITGIKTERSTASGSYRREGSPPREEGTTTGSSRAREDSPPSGSPSTTSSRPCPRPWRMRSFRRTRRTRASSWSTRAAIEVWVDQRERRSAPLHRQAGARLRSAPMFAAPSRTMSSSFPAICRASSSGGNLAREDAHLREPGRYQPLRVCLSDAGESRPGQARRRPLADGGARHRPRRA